MIWGLDIASLVRDFVIGVGGISALVTLVKLGKRIVDAFISLRVEIQAQKFAGELLAQQLTQLVATVDNINTKVDKTNHDVTGIRTMQNGFLRFADKVDVTIDKLKEDVRELQSKAG